MNFDAYSSSFHPNWIGIIGTAAVVVLIAVALGTAWRKRKVRHEA
jgi:uncharacterized membrane protein YdjX (TVP38/TMEM64 family)